MDRVWTLQECVQSRRVLFLTDGGQEIWPLETFCGPSFKYVSPVTWRLAATFENMLNRDGSSMDLASAMIEMEYRNMSKPDDGILALAPLLQVPLNVLLHQNDKERRTEQFWLNVPNLPRNVIFQKGPKLQREGFQWANRNLLRQQPGFLHLPVDASMRVSDDNAIRYAKCTNQGLEATFIAAFFGADIRLDSNSHLQSRSWQAKSQSL